jgi:hypothetical protein
MRSIAIAPELADALGKLIAARGGVAFSARVRIQDLEAIERDLGVRLPDPVIAYVAAGVSAWGDGPINLAAIRARTLDVIDLQEDGGETEGRRFAVIDDDSNGNYIAIVAGARADSSAVRFLDHEESYTLDGGVLDLLEVIEDRLATEIDPGAPLAPFSVELYDRPDPPPAEIWVSHVKFGRGKVLAQADDVITVLFDSAGQKRLKRSFLSFD